jgi:hypothetical protein
VASARGQAPSSTGHSENTHQSQNQPVLANVYVLNGRVKFACLESLKLGWKRVDNGETEKKKRPRKKLVKRKVSKEREARGSGEC